MTNGGGKTEEARVADLTEKLDVQLDTSMLVQSHTPFSKITKLHEKTVLVVGGDAGKCAEVARGYGFKHVVTPGDILVSHPDIWPFSHVFMDYYKSFAKPLPKPIEPESKYGLKFDAIFVYNDPRDWGLDSTIIIDLLLSRQGVMGTLSAKNGDRSLPDNGYLQDGQPMLYFSNPDLWWASSHSLPRLGQGGFRECLAGVWRKVTGGNALKATIIGKPHKTTYRFAEQCLRDHRAELFGTSASKTPLKRVYMIGDNPESDIKGANRYKSSFGSEWSSILVKTGVYTGGTPAEQPTHIAEDVNAAVTWALEQSEWQA